MSQTLVARQEALMLQVLDVWQGTPEELGAAIEDATRRPWLWGSEEYRRREREEIAASKRRLLACGDEGRELLQVSMKLRD